MTWVMWMTGLTCVGKTYYVNERKEEGDGVVVISPGKFCRDTIGEDAISKMKNPAAPVELDEMVRKYIKIRLCAAVGDEAREVYVDGFPRTVEQLDWVRGLMRYKYPRCNSQILVLDCDEALRRNRALNRVNKNPAERELMLARLETDHETMYPVLMGLLRGQRRDQYEVITIHEEVRL